MVVFGGVITLLAAKSFTYNLQSEFVKSPEWRQMLYPGKYDPSMVTETPDGAAIKCSPGDGMIVVGSRITGVQGGKRHTRFSRRWDVQKLEGSGNVGVTMPSGSLSVMCARWGAPWKYASWSLKGGPTDTFAKTSQRPLNTDALVIGFGVGGAAAAAAIRLAGVESIAILHTGSSTTELSTGVMWFPSNLTHTVDMLMEAVGSQTANRTLLAQYIKDGAAAKPFWRQHLVMEQFEKTNPAYDYTAYQSGSKRGNAWQLSSCVGTTGETGNPTCGAVLTQALGRLASVDKEYVGTAKRITQQPNGAFNTELSSGEIITSVILVIATGGYGPTIQELIDPTLVLATGNNGFSSQVQRDLGLRSSSPEQMPRYHVEFKKGQGSSAQVRWFAADTCVPTSSVNGYNLCDDYSARAQAIGSFGAETNTQSGEYKCDAGTSGQYWHDYILSRYPFENYPICPAGATLLAGMIDTKGGFEIGAGYESTELSGLFASGTSAAAFTGDAYYGPGATLGLGMVTGYAIGNIAKQRVDRWKLDQSVSDQGQGEKFSRPIPELFMSSVWILFVGILSHLATNGKWITNRSWLVSLRFAHYILMPIGVVIATIAFVWARGGVIEFYPHGSSHKVIGTVVFVSVWVQSAFGVLALYRNTRSHSTSRFVQVWHRVAGYTILGMLIFLYVSGTQNKAFERHYQWKHKSEAQQSAYAYAAITGAAVLLGTYFTWARASVPPKQKGLAYTPGSLLEDSDSVL